MATTSVLAGVTHSVPKARKSFKGSSSKAKNAGGEETVSGISILDSFDEIPVKGKEENNNDIGAIQLQRADTVYDFEDDEEGIEDTWTGSTKEREVESNLYDEVQEQYKKVPLQMQPQRIRKNAKTLQYECPYCSFSSLYYSAVSNHTLIHTGEKPYKCHLCNYSARQRGHIVIHMRIHSGKKPFKCSQCKYSTIQRAHLRVHMRVHSEDRPFQCPGCNYRSKHLSILQMHIRKAQHNRAFQCDKCDYTTARKHNLTQHMSIHTGVKLFKCDRCPYTSNQKGHLNVHVRSHTGEKPYKCHECPYASTVPKSLRAHMALHQGLRTHKCPDCSFSTFQSFSLKKHIALHTKEKASYRCDRCPYVSTILEDYLEHRNNNHTVTTLYSCTSCDFTTPFKYQHTIHAMKHAEPEDTTSNPLSDANDNSKTDPQEDVHEAEPEKASPTSKMTVTPGKVAQNTNHVNRKSGNRKKVAKLIIKIGSLIKNNKGKAVQSTQPPEQDTSQLHSDSHSDKQVPQETLNFTEVKSVPEHSPKKAKKKSFVCLYCDVRFLVQEEWVRHEMRHFRSWPEIV